MLLSFFVRAAGGVGPYGGDRYHISLFHSCGRGGDRYRVRRAERQRHPARHERLVEPVPLG